MRVLRIVQTIDPPVTLESWRRATTRSVCAHIAHKAGVWYSVELACTAHTYPVKIRPSVVYDLASSVGRTII